MRQTTMNPSEGKSFLRLVMENQFSQTAWKVQHEEGHTKRLMYAESEEGAVLRSRLAKKYPREDLVVERATYADGLKNDVYQLRDVMRANGWNV